MAAPADRPANERPDDGLPRVVVVGAGFGGLAAAKALRPSPVRVTVIDRHNYHLFQPLLYQVATAGLSPADIAAPIRSILSKQRNVEVVLGTVIGIDTTAREVVLAGRRIAYDYLVVAAGARHAYFGRDWETHAPGLKTIDDATAIRARILLAFERAESTGDPALRRQLLTFVLVGGGPTGVEMAGAIAELAKRALAKDFRNIDPRAARIILLEGAAGLLAGFPQTLSDYARRALERLGVEVRTEAMVEAIDRDGVVVAGERIGTRTVIWAAGVKASPAADWFAIAADPYGRVKVAGDLSIPGLNDVFAIGDTALFLDDGGRPLPGLAPVAKQQGAFVGKLIGAKVAGKPHDRTFRYLSAGKLATIGRSAAVVDFGFVRIKGLLAWILWGAAHIYFLIGFRNKLVVMLNWLWAYITFQQGTRLITGSEN